MIEVLQTRTLSESLATLWFCGIRTMDITCCAAFNSVLDPFRPTLGRATCRIEIEHTTYSTIYERGCVQAPASSLMKCTPGFAACQMRPECKFECISAEFDRYNGGRRNRWGQLREVEHESSRPEGESKREENHSCSLTGGAGDSGGQEHGEE